MATNLHAALDVGHRQDAQIRSIVPVIGRAAAERIDGIGAGVHIRKLLHETIAAERAVGRQSKLGGDSVERAEKQPSHQSDEMSGRDPNRAGRGIVLRFGHLSSSDARSLEQRRTEFNADDRCFYSST